jgi:hypothetical protein
LIQHNYTSPGAKEFVCTATSLDGSESASVSFTVDGVKIEDYDILSTNISKRTVSFNAKNYYYPLAANFTVTAENDEFNGSINLSSNEFVMVFSEVNYSTDGAQTFVIDLTASSDSDSYIDSFKFEGVAIEDYQRDTKNHTVQILVFNVRNTWYLGNVTWSLSNPSISNISNLDYNESILVVIEHNYTSQGDTMAEVSANVSSFVDRLTDFFEIQPLQLYDFQTLSESQASSVFELVAQNNLDTVQYFTWTLNSGEENITSDELLNITNENVFIFIETNYSDERVYKTTALINSSSFNDTQNGVIVT